MRKILLLIRIWFIFLYGTGQNDSLSSVINLNAGYHRGIILPHSSKIKNVSESNPWGIEMNVSWHLLDKESWKYCYCYPRTGLSLLYINYLNPEVIGSSISLYPYIEPYIGAERKLNASFRFGIGPAYMTKIYDKDSNPENQFVSTHISFVVLLRMALNYRINNVTGIGFTAGFNHISNGGIRNPNLGINFPTMSLNLERYLEKPAFRQFQRQEGLRLDKDTHKFFLEYFATGKAVHKAEERYLVTGMAASYGLVVGRINGLRFGLEAIYDGAVRERIKRDELPDGFEGTPDYRTLGILFGNDFLLGRFVFYQHLGIYLYEKYTYMDPVYQRYGLSYFLTKSKTISVGINLKAHRHNADFLDFRLGYKF